MGAACSSQKSVAGSKPTAPPTRNTPAPAPASSVSPAPSASTQAATAPPAARPAAAPKVPDIVHGDPEARLTSPAKEAHAEDPIDGTTDWGKSVLRGEVDDMLVRNDKLKGLRMRPTPQSSTRSGNVSAPASAQPSAHVTEASASSSDSDSESEKASPKQQTRAIKASPQGTASSHGVGSVQLGNGSDDDDDFDEEGEDDGSANEDWLAPDTAAVRHEYKDAKLLQEDGLDERFERTNAVRGLRFNAKTKQALGNHAASSSENDSGSESAGSHTGDFLDEPDHAPPASNRSKHTKREVSNGGSSSHMRTATGEASSQGVSEADRVPVSTAELFEAETFFEVEKEWESLKTLKLVFERAGLDEEQQRKFLAALEQKTYRAGQYVVHQGDSANDGFFIITEGEVMVSRNLAPEEVAETPTALLVTGERCPHERVITHLYEGHFFGETALVNDTARNANVRVETGEMRCMVMSKDAFQPFLEQDTKFRKMIGELVLKKQETAQKRDEMLKAQGGSVLTAEQQRNEVKISKLTQKGRTNNGKQIINNYILMQRLGNGAYGVVWMALSVAHSKKYAVKVVSRTLLRRKRIGSAKNQTDEELLREVAVLKRLNHPNIVALYEVIDDPAGDKFYMVQEFMELGPIMTETEYNTALPSDLARKYFRNIVAGLDYLHFQGVVHRDIKPSNILIASDGVAKIADFGTAAITRDGGDFLTDVKGTPAFQPPEVFLLEKGQPYSGFAVDIWALGATLHTMVVGVPPFMADNEVALVERLRTEQFRLALTVELDPHLKNLLLKCLTKDPDKRITLAQITMHPWVTEEGVRPMPSYTYAKLNLADASIMSARKPSASPSSMPRSLNVGEPKRSLQQLKEVEDSSSADSDDSDKPAPIRHSVTNPSVAVPPLLTGVQSPPGSKRALDQPRKLAELRTMKSVPYIKTTPPTDYRHVTQDISPEVINVVSRRNSFSGSNPPSQPTTPAVIAVPEEHLAHLLPPAHPTMVHHSISTPSGSSTGTSTSRAHYRRNHMHKASFHIKAASAAQSAEDDMSSSQKAHLVKLRQRQHNLLSGHAKLGNRDKDLLADQQRMVIHKARAVAMVEEFYVDPSGNISEKPVTAQAFQDVISPTSSVSDRSFAFSGSGRSPSTARPEVDAAVHPSAEGLPRTMKTIGSVRAMQTMRLTSRPRRMSGSGMYEPSRHASMHSMNSELAHAMGDGNTRASTGSFGGSHEGSPANVPPPMAALQHSTTSDDHTDQVALAMRHQRRRSSGAGSTASAAARATAAAASGDSSPRAKPPLAASPRPPATARVATSHSNSPAHTHEDSEDMQHVEESGSSDEEARASSRASTGTEEAGMRSTLSRRESNLKLNGGLQRREQFVMVTADVENAAGGGAIVRKVIFRAKGKDGYSLTSGRPAVEEREAQIQKLQKAKQQKKKKPSPPKGLTPKHAAAGIVKKGKVDSDSDSDANSDSSEDYEGLATVDDMEGGGLSSDLAKILEDAPEKFEEDGELLNLADEEETEWSRARTSGLSCACPVPAPAQIFETQEKLIANAIDQGENSSQSDSEQSVSDDDESNDSLAGDAWPGKSDHALGSPSAAEADVGSVPAATWDATVVNGRFVSCPIGANRRIGLIYGSASHQGRRGVMEDRTVTIPNFNASMKTIDAGYDMESGKSSAIAGMPSEELVSMLERQGKLGKQPIYSYFAVFDGHNGISTCEALAQSLHLVVAEKLKLVSSGTTPTSCGNTPIIASVCTPVIGTDADDENDPVKHMMAEGARLAGHHDNVQDVTVVDSRIQTASTAPAVPVSRTSTAASAVPVHDSLPGQATEEPVTATAGGNKRTMLRATSAGESVHTASNKTLNAAGVPIFRGDDGDASVCVPTEFEYQVLMDSCLQMDADILAAYEPGDMISGSTGVIVLVKAPQIPGNPPMIFCANVGDSRAVLCRAGRKVDLSFDHKAKRPDERARILAAGGTVVKDRLHGVLAVSRAFGDGEHKMGLGEELWGKEFSADPLSAEPEVTHEALQPSDEFVIVACDGIWDVMTSQQAVNYVRRRLIKHRNVQKAAKELVQKAMAMGSADNVSVVIVCFV